jgi:hypothetical protein
MAKSSSRLNIWTQSTKLLRHLNVAFLPWRSLLSLAIITTHLLASAQGLPRRSQLSHIIVTVHLLAHERISTVSNPQILTVILRDTIHKLRNHKIYPPLDRVDCCLLPCLA